MEPMHYRRNGQVTDIEGTLRMSTYNELTVGQFAGLPNGTEVLVIDIHPLGMGLKFNHHVVDDEVKERLLDPANHDTCDHGMSRQEIEESGAPGSVFIVLLPENLEPDMNEIMFGPMVKLGVRHGREGSPQFSESMLRDKYKEQWNDGAYAAYVTAYKRGVESRKGR